MFDNDYPHSSEDFDSSYYPAEEKPTEDQVKTSAAIATSLPIMSNVAEWFEEQIQRCDSINNIKIEAHTINGIKYTRKVSIEGQVLAYQMLKQLLEDKARDFQRFVEEAQDE